MMGIFSEFVGRTNELKQIKHQIESHNERSVVNISGSGGVGKTTLLKQIKNEYGNKAGFLVTEIIDFSRTAFRVQTWVEEQIIQTNRPKFSHYTAEKAKVDSASSVDRPALLRYATDIFIDEYNAIAQNEARFILLIDTIELVQETALLEGLLEVFARLKNTVFLFAGRNNDEIVFKERLSQIGGPEIVNIPLKGFDSDEARIYFQKAASELSLEIHKDLENNIYELSKGSPIKIALSLDWLKRGIPLMSEITQMKPETLKNMAPGDLEKLQEQFERALMTGMRGWESDLDPNLPAIIQYMAHFHKRFNRKMVEFFFLQKMESTERERESRRLVDIIRTLPFVKYLNDDFFVLHDEMIRLVQKYVLDELVDPDKSLRSTISTMVLDYYRGEINSAHNLDYTKEQERISYWSYRTEAMYYHLYADFQAGYKEFEELFESLVGDYRPNLASLAVDFLKEFANWPEYSELVRCFVEGYYQGGIYLAQGKLDKAEVVLVKGEQNYQEFLNNQFRHRVSQVDAHLLGRQYDIYNQLGYLYRNLGKHQLAVDYYHQSLNHALETVKKLDVLPGKSAERKRELIAKIAETVNNLANVHRLLGEFHKAQIECQTSVLLRKAWDENQLAKSRYVMSMIMWEMGGTAEAIHYLHDAELACRPGDENIRALIRKYRAYLLFRAGTSKEELFPILQNVEEMFRRRGHYSELADTLVLKCRITRDQLESIDGINGKIKALQEAESYAMEALERAQESGDRFRLSECHLTLALLYHAWARIDKKASDYYIQQATQENEEGLKLAQEGQYVRLLSVFDGIKGDIEFERQSYSQAFNFYIEQCELATHFKRAVLDRAIDILGDRMRSLTKQEDTAIVKHYASHLTTYWVEKGLHEKCPELIQEIEQVMDSINQQEQLDHLLGEYQSALNYGDWDEAASYCDRMLTLPILYSDVQRANVLLKKAHALHTKGDLTAARRLAKVVLQIGTDLKDRAMIGNAYLLLATVLWDTTNTAEASTALKHAIKEFEKVNDDLGKARAIRLMSFIQIRTDQFSHPFEELMKLLPIFKKHKSNEELADIWNLLSRIARTDPDRAKDESSRRKALKEAREYANEALKYAQISGNSYRISESYITLALLEMDEKNYSKVLEYCEKGMAITSKETHLLHSVYHEIIGRARLGQIRAQQKDPSNWMNVIQAYTLGLVEATESKPSRFIFLADVLYNLLMQAPIEFIPDLTNHILEKWEQGELAQKYPTVIEMCEYVTRYRPFVEQV